MNPLAVCFSLHSPFFSRLCYISLSPSRVRLQKDFPTLLLAPFTTIDAPRFWYGNNQGGTKFHIFLSRLLQVILHTGVLNKKKSFLGHLEIQEKLGMTWLNKALLHIVLKIADQDLNHEVFLEMFCCALACQQSSPCSNKMATTTTGIASHTSPLVPQEMPTCLQASPFSIVVETRACRCRRRPTAAQVNSSKLPPSIRG